jgi:hypothetical protein
MKYCGRVMRGKLSSLSLELRTVYYARNFSQLGFQRWFVGTTADVAAGYMHIHRFIIGRDIPLQQPLLTSGGLAMEEVNISSPCILVRSTSKDGLALSLARKLNSRLHNGSD